MPTQEQLQAFHAAVIQHIQYIDKKVYHPELFIRLMIQNGAYDAACQVIHSKGVPYGFSRLQNAGRLDLTIESFILREEWSRIFETETLLLARKRLADFGYHV